MDAKPKFYRPRPVALSLREKVFNEIDRLRSLGVITPIKHSEWATPIVPIVKTDGSIRLCGDYKVTVNPVLLTDTYPLPRPDDLFAALAGGKIFSKLDLKHAYLQIPLDEASKKYTTINTQKGLFQYERLPFGVSSAPSLFQRTIENLLCHLHHVCVYIDDILVTGTDEVDHLNNLHAVLQTLEEAGLTLKQSKCKFAVPSVEYLGHIIDADGLHPSEAKVKAIREAPTPTNVTELKSFLGLLNYYHKFLPDVATVLAPLHQLLRKDTTWKWSQNQEKAFQQAKAMLHSSSILIHYDEKKPLVVACDASSYGLGAVLSHRMPDGSDLPVAYASRMLSPAEKKYSQLEKEALAIIFAVHKFHDYIYGRKFVLHSDHKPLQFLLSESKQIPLLASSRIQRWAITLSAYNYVIQYRPGKSLPHADALSRLPLPNYPSSVPMPQDVVLMFEHISEAIVSADDIKKWTDKDPTLSRLRQLVLSGGEVPDDAHQLKPYLHCFTELSVASGCLLRGSRVIVPLQGRSTILSQLHEAHQGMSKMKSLARSYFWWPGLDKEIEDLVKKCKRCQELRALPPQTPVHPWECPKTPWTRVHIDHAGPFLGHYFLILVDAHSRWLEAHIVPSTSSEATIKVLRHIFSTHGLPHQLVSDNGPSFTSNEFQKFMSLNGIRHSLTAPYHPRSNGLAERAVQTFKNAIKKMDGPLHERIARFLFSYRITPQSTTGQSPAELLMGRRVRSVLDTAHPDFTHPLQKEKTHSTTRSFKLQDKLFARNYSGKPLWIPVVVCKVTGPLSYHVETMDGVVLKRHADQLRRRYTVDSESDTLPEDSDWDDDFTPSVPDLPPHPAAPPPIPPPIRRSTRSRIITDHGPYVC